MYVLQAHGLANFCVTRDEREIRNRLVYDIETSWYKGNHPLSYSEYKELAREHKQLLEDLREKTREEFLEPMLLESAIDLKKVFTAANMRTALHFTERVFTKSKTLCKDLVNFTKKILQSSINIQRKTGKSPPCNFAVIGLGSIAKGEATPYSDIEYAFIVEEHSEYFIGLAVDSYFRIGNLRETPLKCFDIEELKEASVSPEAQTVGYRIDGITKKSGNIPTGNGRADGQSLTLTVDEFMELYQKSAEHPFGGMAGDISDLLYSTVLVLSNQGVKSSLYENFEKRVDEMHESLKLSKAVATKRVDSFSHDLEEYTFLPTFTRFQPPKNTNIKIKTDIFRYPTLLANNIKLCMGLKLSHSSDVYNKLGGQKLLQEEVYHYLKIILGISMYMRVAAYLDYRSQTETVLLTVDPYMRSSMKKRTSMLSPTLFVLLGLLLVPIKKAVKSGTELLKKPLAHQHLEKATRDVIKKLRVQRPNALLQAEIYYFTGDYKQAKVVLSSVVRCSFETVKCLNFREQIANKFNVGASEVKYVELGCYVLYQTGEWKAANDYLKWLMVNKRENISLWNLLSAHCYKELCDLPRSRQLIDEVRLLDF